MILLAVPDLPWEVLVILGGAIVSFVQWLMNKGERVRQKSLQERSRRFGEEPPAEPEEEEEEAVVAEVVPPAPTPYLPFPGVRIEVARPRRPARVEPATPPPSPLPPVPRPPKRSRAAAIRRRRLHPLVARLRRDRDGLREAIVLREVLGPPRALRHRSRW